MTRTPDQDREIDQAIDRLAGIFQLPDCYLHQSDRWSLWMGCAAFDVSDAECERIQATFPQIRVKKAEPAISPIEGIA